MMLFEALHTSPQKGICEQANIWKESGPQE